jgi:hypothetical protein
MPWALTKSRRRRRRRNQRRLSLSCTGTVSVKHHSMKMCGEEKVLLHAFLDVAVT